MHGWIFTRACMTARAINESAFFCSTSLLSSLARCDGNHKHDKWGPVMRCGRFHRRQYLLESAGPVFSSASPPLRAATVAPSVALGRANDTAARWNLFPMMVSHVILRPGRNCFFRPHPAWAAQLGGPVSAPRRVRRPFRPSRSSFVSCSNCSYVEKTNRIVCYLGRLGRVKTFSETKRARHPFDSRSGLRPLVMKTLTRIHEMGPEAVGCPLDAPCRRPRNSSLFWKRCDWPPKLLRQLLQEGRHLGAFPKKPFVRAGQGKTASAPTGSVPSGSASSKGTVTSH